MLKEIQTSDYDRYISLIFSPKESRDTLLTIVRFNLEIARIKNRVSEPMLGVIRLQWWREALDEVFDLTKTPRKHELTFALRNALQSYPTLDKADFLTIINAREKDLEKNPFKNETEFNDYLINTSFPLNKIILDILGCNNPKIIEATQYISYAWAITAILRSAPKNLSKGRIVFPEDLMKKYDLKIDLFGSEEFLKNSYPLVKQLVLEAESKLIEAEKILKTVNKKDKKATIPILLFSEIAKHYIKQISKSQYNIFSKNIMPLSFTRLIKIYIKSI